MCCLKSTIFIWLCIVECVCAQQQPQPPAASESQTTSVTVDGSVLLVNGQPYFPRIVQHNGESFEFLKSLGFNTIQLRSPATQEQLKEARQSGVWIISLPPSFLGTRSISREYQPVLAWSLGNQLSANQIQLTREQITDIRDADPLKRPVFAQAKSHWESYGRLADILGVGKQIIGSNHKLRDYGRWVSGISAGQIQPIWTDIQTQLPDALGEQIQAFTGSRPPTPLQHQQLQFQMYEAIAGGSRGLRFLSRSRLDADDPETKLRTTSLSWLLGHAEQMEPWLAGGLVRRKSSLSTGSRSVVSVDLPGSQLLLIQRSTGYEQWACGDIPRKTIDLASISKSSSDRVYRLDELGATLLQDRSTLPGTRIKIPNASCSTAVVITSDPAIVARINSQLSGTPIGLQQKLELVEQSLAYVQFVEQALATTGIGFPVVGGARQTATKDLNNARQMSVQGNYQVAAQYLANADTSIASVGRTLIDSQLRNRNGIFSTPLLKHVGLIPSHLQSSLKFADSPWNPNALTGGDFENLSQMTNAGWKNRRNHQNGFTTQVELDTDAAVQGSYGLKLSVENSSYVTANLETAPLWIESSPVAVKEGQLIRIHGFVNVSQLSSSNRGFEIADSIAGSELAVPFASNAGWQEFTIYRAAQRDTNIKLTFSVNGVGTAMIDEVTVRTLDSAQVQQQASSSDSPKR